MTARLEASGPRQLMENGTMLQQAGLSNLQLILSFLVSL